MLSGADSYEKQTLKVGVRNCVERRTCRRTWSESVRRGEHREVHSHAECPGRRIIVAFAYPGIQHASSI